MDLAAKRRRERISVGDLMEQKQVEKAVSQIRRKNEHQFDSSTNLGLKSTEKQNFHYRLMWGGCLNYL